MLTELMPQHSGLVGFEPMNQFSGLPKRALIWPRFTKEAGVCPGGLSTKWCNAPPYPACFEFWSGGI